MQHDDTIDVRAEERFDEARLDAYLREAFAKQDDLPALEGELEVRQFGGGHANLTYLLRYLQPQGEALELVLRRPPLGPVAPKSHDMKREYRALSVLWRAFSYAPRAYHYCADPAVLGAHFLVMERRDGVVVRGAIPEVFGGGADEVANRRISEAIVDVLAELHDVDPAKVGLDDFGRPEGFLARQVRGWGERYERARTSDLALPGELVRWLEANLPESPPPALLHNDWRLDNMALSPSDPGRCTAVYDWDMCTLGDPLCDLGTVLVAWPAPDEPAAGPGAMPTHAPGFLAREEAVERYCARRGVDPASVPYYQVFGNFKMAVVLQ